MRFQYTIRKNSPVDEQRDRELEDYLASLQPTAWTAVTLLNGWTNVSDQVPQLRRVGDMVQTRGHANAGTLTAGTILFVLPVGSRPPAGLDLTVEPSPDGAGHFYCQANGNMGLYLPAGTGSVSWFNEFSISP